MGHFSDDNIWRLYIKIINVRTIANNKKRTLPIMKNIQGEEMDRNCTVRSRER